MATATASPARKSLAKRALATNPTVDVTTMSARFTISTPTEDRAGDVVNQFGIKLENYKRNPIVMYNHGVGIIKPIGKSALPSGALAVYRSSKGTEADCYFSQSSLEAAQIFELVQEGVLNCASVRLDPLRATTRYASDGRSALDIVESDLLEWSIVDIPCNAQAVRKVLDRNRLAGRTIVEPLQKSLANQVEHFLDRGDGETPHQRLTRLENVVGAMCESTGAIGLALDLGQGDSRTRMQRVQAILGQLLEEANVANTPPDSAAMATLERQVKELAELVDAFDATKSFRRLIDQRNEYFAGFKKAADRLMLRIKRQEVAIEEYVYSLKYPKGTK